MKDNPEEYKIVMERVVEHYYRNQRKWGQQNHTPAEWLAILSEEFGEVAREVNEKTFRSPSDIDLYYELADMIAVGISMMSALVSDELLKSIREENDH